LKIYCCAQVLLPRVPHGCGPLVLCSQLMAATGPAGLDYLAPSTGAFACTESTFAGSFEL
jgi:hypothetical protein